MELGNLLNHCNVLNCLDLITWPGYFLLGVPILRYKPAILIVGHHSILFPVGSPKRKAKPHLSVNLLFSITDHRGSKFIKHISWWYHSPPQPDGKLKSHWWVEDLMGIAWQAHLPSSLSLSPSFSSCGVSSFYFFLLLIPFLNSSSFFWVGWHQRAT